METIHPALSYFTATTAATGSGILYWHAVENMREYKYKYVLAFIASVFFSPAGAWILSMFIKANHLRSQRASTPA